MSVTNAEISLFHRQRSGMRQDVILGTPEIIDGSLEEKKKRKKLHRMKLKANIMATSMKTKHAPYNGPIVGDLNIAQASP